MPRRIHPKRVSSHVKKSYLKLARKEKNVTPKDKTKSWEAKLLYKLKKQK